ncbi:hypothetical protein CEC48_24905 [Pseudomonas sp. K2I15]|nr:hypothetical protein CEC48_24905 [Pseudomonas sp. K2I15]
MWERACSRKRWFSQHIQRLTHRLREQARSHIGFAVLLIIRITHPAPAPGASPRSPASLAAFLSGHCPWARSPA